jgi:hypothetical protein
MQPDLEQLQPLEDFFYDIALGCTFSQFTQRQESSQPKPDCKHSQYDLEHRDFLHLQVIFF